MSARSELAQRIADFIMVNGLVIPYGGDVIKHGNHYSVLFAAPKVLDGVVNVYGPKFIQITYQTQYRDLPNRDRPVFESEADALKFIDKAFVNRDFAGAMVIPRKAK